MFIAYLNVRVFGAQMGIKATKFVLVFIKSHSKSLLKPPTTAKLNIFVVRRILFSILKQNIILFHTLSS